MRAEIIGQVEVEIFVVLMNLHGRTGNKIYLVKERALSYLNTKDCWKDRKVLSAKKIKGIYSKQLTKCIWSQDLRKRKQKNCRKATLGTKKNYKDEIQECSVISPLFFRYTLKTLWKMKNDAVIAKIFWSTPEVHLYYNEHFFTRVERYLFISSHYGDFEK